MFDRWSGDAIVFWQADRNAYSRIEWPLAAANFNSLCGKGARNFVMRPARIEEDKIPLGVRVANLFAEQFVPGVALGLDLRAYGRNVVCILQAGRAATRLSRLRSKKAPIPIRFKSVASSWGAST
jgi:hypothetical protein